MVQLNLLLFIFLAVFLLRSGTQVFLNRLNISYLRQKGGWVPEIFQDVIDREVKKAFRKEQNAYTALTNAMNDWMSKTKSM